MTAVRLDQVRAVACRVDEPGVTRAQFISSPPSIPTPHCAVTVPEARERLATRVHLDARQVDCLMSAAVAVRGRVGEGDVGVLAEFAFEGILQLMELDLIRSDPECVAASSADPPV